MIEESSIEFEHEVEDQEEVVEKFKDFLDEVTPEDFAAGEELPSEFRPRPGRERQVEDPLDQLLEGRCPAASAAIGSRLVSVRPGIALTSSTCGPSAPSIRSTRAKPSQPSASQVRSAASRTAAASLGVELGRADELGAPDLVAGLVVVAVLLARGSPRRSAAASPSSTLTASSRPSTWRSSSTRSS